MRSEVADCQCVKYVSETETRTARRTLDEEMVAQSVSYSVMLATLATARRQEQLAIRLKGKDPPRPRK